MSGALPGGNRIWGWGIAALILIGLLAGWKSRRAATPDGDPQMIVQASLETLKEQQVLTPFIARYVAVVPQTTTSAGSPQLLLVPGTVRYEVDVEGVRASDLEWNATTKELEIKLPKLRVNGPDIIHDAIARWRGGGKPVPLAKKEGGIDRASRRNAEAQLLEQARAKGPMEQAKAAVRAIVKRSFSAPLKSAGVDAGVKVYFADEG
ncbi:DUF4230 domain-containing protein [Pseudonocardia sp. TMWB2A]|uniref:DUF4230 domain-containing protein n=1 Tax=Pseudonocardia sp. TMWB2A TaxID=687430 RepID=UPI00307EF871